MSIRSTIQRYRPRRCLDTLLSALSWAATVRVPSDALTSGAPIPASQESFGQESAGRTCTVCHVETELDDVAIVCATGGCVCLRCSGHETGVARPMSKALRRQLSTALAEQNRA